MVFSRILAGMLVAGLLLSACAHAPRVPAVALPALQLPPASLGKSMALQQRLEFRFGTHSRQMDALLEVDAAELRLLVQAMGQTGVTLRWDGLVLEQRRAPWLPEGVRGERVLDDLQFALWPAVAIRAALPAGWSLYEDGRVRELRKGGIAWLSLVRTGDARIELHNRAAGYDLRIESIALPADGDQP
jgi:hypothetical protein